MTGRIITDVEELHEYLKYGETSAIFDIDPFIVVMVFLLIVPILIIAFIK